MQTNPLTTSEAYQWGVEDKRKHHAADIYAHLKPWAKNFWKYEAAYLEGYNSTPYEQEAP